MAHEGTRLKVLDDQMKTLETQFSKLQTDVTKAQQETNKKIDENHKTILTLLESMKQAQTPAPPQTASSSDPKSSTSILGPPVPATPTQKTPQTNPVTPETTYNPNFPFQPILQPANLLWPKMEFSYFDGKQPRTWLRKCQKVFQVYNIPEENKVESAAMFLDEKPDIWYRDWKEGQDVLKWKEFEEDFCSRFACRTEGNAIEEFHRLKQTATVEEYQEKFEELKAIVRRQNPGFSEEYLVTVFVGGLKEELGWAVKRFKPTTLKEAFEQAKLNEAV